MKTQYHIYTNRKDRTGVFVIHGLPSDLATKDITQELQQLGIKALKCNTMRGTAKPLYILEGKITSASKH